MLRRILTASAFAAAAATLAAGPVLAQKSKDNLRIAVTDMFGVLDPYHFPLDEAGQFYRTVYSTLVGFNEYKQEFVPELAKAWRRIDETTLEFDLRDDVKFHNGDSFDADDVIHTINYLKDPKVRIRFKGRYAWVTKVEKLGPYKIRIHAKEPFSTDLSSFAYRFAIYDSKIHAKLKDKSEYGQAPIATGPYKVVSLDRGKGLILERWDGYFDKASGYHPAPVKTVHAIPMPERQTQVAQILTGGVDLLRNVTADNARELAKMPNIKITVSHSGMVMYVTLDAAGRSDNKIMTDHRVREAFMKAINREELVNNIVPGGKFAEKLRGICVKSDVGCKITTQVEGFDPEGAKRLLAEAGYPNGVDLTLHVHDPIKQVGEAIAGYLRQAGFRTSVQPLPLALYVRLRAQGKFTAFNGFYPTSAQPEVANLMDFFFAGSRDYYHDPVIHDAAKKGEVEFDMGKRGDIYQAALDRVNEMNYIYPVSELPFVWGHTTDVVINDNPLSALERRLGDWAWAK